MTSFRAKFCPDCGRELGKQWLEHKERPYCESCDRIIFQRPIPCTDVAVVDGDDVLLIKRTNPPHVGKWALPGGVLEAGESPAVGAVRELEEETGLSVTPDELMIICGYEASAPQGWYNAGYVYAIPYDRTVGEILAGGDARDVRFWNLDELRTSQQDLRPDPDDELHIQQSIDKLSH